MPTNQQIILDNRPQGEAVASNFKLVTSETAPLKPNEVLVRHHYMSLDPYMRGRMNDSKSYAAAQPVGQVFQGGTVGEVVESQHPKYAVGDKVVGFGGWQQYSVVDASVPGSLKVNVSSPLPLASMSSISAAVPSACSSGTSTSPAFSRTSSWTDGPALLTAKVTG